LEAVPRWEPETAWEPETVNRKGLQVTKSLEASKTGGSELQEWFRNTKQVLGSFATC
jgi:hypothetical protein